MKKIEAFIRHESFEPIRMELLGLGFPSLSISEVKGSGLWVWDVKSGDVLRRWTEMGEKLWDLGFEDDGKTLLTGGTSLRVWNVDSGKNVEAYRCGQSGEVIGIWPSRSGKDRQVVSGDGRLYRIPLGSYSTETIANSRPVGRTKPVSPSTTKSPDTPARGKVSAPRSGFAAAVCGIEAVGQLADPGRRRRVFQRRNPRIVEQQHEGSGVLAD